MSSQGLPCCALRRPLHRVNAIGRHILAMRPRPVEDSALDTLSRYVAVSTRRVLPSTPGAVGVAFCGLGATNVGVATRKPASRRTRRPTHADVPVNTQLPGDGAVIGRCSAGCAGGAVGHIAGVPRVAPESRHASG